MGLGKPAVMLLLFDPPHLAAAAAGCATFPVESLFVAVEFGNQTGVGVLDEKGG